MKGDAYRTLAMAVGVHFFIMWSLTYVGVYAFDHIVLNVNRFYMAVVMVAPMVIVMLAFMSSMFQNKRLNIALYAGSALLFIATFAAIRTQAFVGDEELMQAMIPHHSIAIKNCEFADLDDPEVVELCDQIVQAQREEIALMKDILDRSY